MIFEWDWVEYFTSENEILKEYFLILTMWLTGQGNDWKVHVKAFRKTINFQARLGANLEQMSMLWHLGNHRTRRLHPGESKLVFKKKFICFYWRNITEINHATFLTRAAKFTARTKPLDLKNHPKNPVSIFSLHFTESHSNIVFSRWFLLLLFKY